MFKRIDSNQNINLNTHTVDIIFEGQTLPVPAGISVAAALLFDNHADLIFRQSLPDIQNKPPSCNKMILGCPILLIPD